KASSQVWRFFSCWLSGGYSPYHSRSPPLQSRLKGRGERSEGETSTDCRSNVVVVVIGDAGLVRNGDGQTAADVGIRNAGINVETLGEVMIRVERKFVEGARAGTAEASRDRAARGKTKVVLLLMVPSRSNVGFGVVSVFHARPPDLHDLGRIQIVVFDA